MSKPHPPKDKDKHPEEDKNQKQSHDQVKGDDKPHPQEKARPERRRTASQDKGEELDYIEDEPPPVVTKDVKATKLLDDLFRKTKATPSIYWLPLTEAQVRRRSVCVSLFAPLVPVMIP